MQLLLQSIEHIKLFLLNSKVKHSLDIFQNLEMMALLFKKQLSFFHNLKL